MKKIPVALLSLALSLVVVAPGLAAPVKAAGRTGALPVSSDGVAALLYGQNDSPAANGVPDQDFEASFDAYDAEAADDFVVTDPTGWTIDEVRTVGTTGTAGAATVKVTFHSNSAGGGDPDLPGAAVAGCSYTGIVPTDVTGSFTILLPTPCVLAAGTYWVAIQTSQNFGANGQHFWSNRTVQTTSESAWRNPLGGFAVGCLSYSPVSTCTGAGGPVGGGFPDLLFEIWGTIGGAGPVPGDLSILKTGIASPGIVTYTITVANAGPGDVTGIVVTDPLPAAVAYVSDDCGGGNTPPWTWNVGTVVSGGSAVCNVTTSVVTPGAIDNTATVTADNDSTQGNNTSTASVVGVPQVDIIEVPTLDNAGLAVLLAALAACALVMMRRRAGV